MLQEGRAAATRGMAGLCRGGDAEINTLCLTADKSPLLTTTPSTPGPGRASDWAPVGTQM